MNAKSPRFDGRTFLHPCQYPGCRAWGAYGYGVRLALAGILPRRECPRCDGTGLEREEKNDDETH